MTLIEDRDEARRWGGSLALVLLAHSASALVTAWWLGPMISTAAPEPAILIDMAPPAAPPVPPSEQPPGPKQAKAEVPKPKLQEDPVRTPPVVNPAVAMRGRCRNSFNISQRLISPPEKPTFTSRRANASGSSAPASFSNLSPASSALPRDATVTPSSAGGHWNALPRPGLARMSIGRPSMR